MIKSAIQNILALLKYFPLRLCEKLQLSLILSFNEIAGSREGAKIRDKLAKRVELLLLDFEADCYKVQDSIIIKISFNQ